MLPYALVEMLSLSPRYLDSFWDILYLVEGGSKENIYNDEKGLAFLLIQFEDLDLLEIQRGPSIFVQFMTMISIWSLLKYAYADLVCLNYSEETSEPWWSIERSRR